MDPFDVSPELLRVAEAAVFASREPLTWQALAPLLPRDLDPGVVFTALVLSILLPGFILPFTASAIALLLRQRRA